MCHRLRKPEVAIRISMLSANHVNRNTGAQRIRATIGCAFAINVALVPTACLVIFAPHLAYGQKAGRSRLFETGRSLQ